MSLALLLVFPPQLLGYGFLIGARRDESYTPMADLNLVEKGIPFYGGVSYTALASEERNPKDRKVRLD